MEIKRDTACFSNRQFFIEGCAAANGCMFTSKEDAEAAMKFANAHAQDKVTEACIKVNDFIDKMY